MSQEFSCLVMVWNMLTKYDIMIVMIPSTILLAVLFDLFWVEGKIRDIYYGARDPSMPLSTSNANPKTLKKNQTI